MDDKKETAFYYELGRFITAFSLIETAMHNILKHAAGLADPKAMAIFGGEQIKPVLEFIQRLLPLSSFNKEQRAELALLITQTQVISKFRNNLIHRSAAPTDEGFVSFNTNKAK